MANVYFEGDNSYYFKDNDGYIKKCQIELKEGGHHLTINPDLPKDCNAATLQTTFITSGVLRALATHKVLKYLKSSVDDVLLKNYEHRISITESEITNLKKRIRNSQKEDLDSAEGKVREYRDLVSKWQKLIEDKKRAKTDLYTVKIFEAELEATKTSLTNAETKLDDLKSIQSSLEPNLNNKQKSLKELETIVTILRRQSRLVATLPNLKDMINSIGTIDNTADEFVKLSQDILQLGDTEDLAFLLNTVTATRLLCEMIDNKEILFSGALSEKSTTIAKSIVFGILRPVLTYKAIMVSSKEEPLLVAQIPRKIRTRLRNNEEIVIQVELQNSADTHTIVCKKEKNPCEFKIKNPEGTVTIVFYAADLFKNSRKLNVAVAILPDVSRQPQRYTQNIINYELDQDIKTEPSQVLSLL